MNDQRRVIFEQRKEIMNAESVADTVTDMRHEVATDLVASAMPEGTYPDQWNADELKEGAMRYHGLDIPADEWCREDGMDQQVITERLITMADTRMAEKAVRFTPEIMRMAEKSLLLQVLDQQWKEHLLALDHMKQAVGLRSYAQKTRLTNTSVKPSSCSNRCLLICAR